MTEGVIWKQIFFFTLPLLAGNLFQQLYNTVDSIVVGNYVGQRALAAVAASTPIVNIIVGFFMGMSAGASIVISMYFGARDRKGLRRSVHASMLIAAVLGLILTFIGIFISPLLLRLISTPAGVMESAVLYLRIYFGGMLALMIYNMGSSVLRAVGDSRRPLYFLCVSSVINIGLDLLFVIVFRWGIAGVAWATLIAQVVSAILVLLVLLRSQEDFSLNPRELRLDLPMIKRVMLLGMPAGLQQCLISFSNLFVQSYINQFDEAVMAGFGAYIKVDSFILLPVQSVSLAVTTFVGQNVGAGSLERAEKGTRVSLFMSLGVTAALSALINIFAGAILRVFCPEEEVIAAGLVFMKAFSPFYFTLCFCQVYSGALRGAGDARTPMLVMTFSFVILRQIFLFIGTRVLPSLELVAFSYPVTWLFAGAAVWLHYRRGKWKTICSGEPA